MPGSSKEPFEPPDTLLRYTAPLGKPVDRHSFAAAVANKQDLAAVTPVKLVQLSPILANETIGRLHPSHLLDFAANCLVNSGLQSSVNGWCVVHLAVSDNVVDMLWDRHILVVNKFYLPLSGLSPMR